ncbi:17027_t:CDS:1, partial [Dentiscutata erythropus]
TLKKLIVKAKSTIKEHDQALKELEEACNEVNTIKPEKRRIEQHINELLN